MKPTTFNEAMRACLALNQGAKVAVTGKSGSGKSQFCDALEWELTQLGKVVDTGSFYPDFRNQLLPRPGFGATHVILDSCAYANQVPRILKPFRVWSEAGPSTSELVRFDPEAVLVLACYKLPASWVRKADVHVDCEVIFAWRGTGMEEHEAHMRRRNGIGSTLWERLGEVD